MISGANEEQLELAGARMDIMLATNYTSENPGPLAIIDKYHDKEIDRLNNIINELEKWLNENWNKPLAKIYVADVVKKISKLKENKII